MVIEAGRVSSVLALDPGSTQSGWCIYQDGKVSDSGIEDNHALLRLLKLVTADDVAIEMIASYGMAVGKEVFETCVWIGRFMEAFEGRVSLIYRRDVKLHLCGTVRAKDANVRAALLDKVGPQGTKAAPGPTFGIKSHAWAALAVAVTFTETRINPSFQTGQDVATSAALITADAARPDPCTAVLRGNE